MRVPLRLVFIVGAATVIAPPVPAATIGSPLVHRPVTDNDSGQVYVYDGVTQPFQITGLVTSWSFFDDRDGGRWVTPLLFKINGDGTFTVTGIGTSEQSNDVGVQSQPFGLIAGSNLVTPGHYTFGFTDRIYSLIAEQVVAGAPNPGVIEWSGPRIYTDPWLATAFVTTGGPVALNVGSTVGGSGLPFDTGTGDAGRIYSAQATATVLLLPGDADLDEKVDFTDLVILARHYGQKSATWADGDFNSDGSVGFDDLVILARNYGQTLSAAQLSQLGPALRVNVEQAFAQVPEPSAFSLLAFIAAGLLRRRRESFS